MQKEQKGFKLIKVRTETVKELDKLIKKIEKKQPYLKNVVSYNSIIQMLLFKKKIKISKCKYIIKK